MGKHRIVYVTYPIYIVYIGRLYRVSISPHRAAKHRVLGVSRLNASRLFWQCCTLQKMSMIAWALAPCQSTRQHGRVWVQQ